MTHEEIAAIRRTWARVAPVAPMAAQLFYGRLFRIAPAARPLFRNDMARQGAKLVATLAYVVDHLDDADTLGPTARDLAIRHVDYGVTADQYAPVGEALLWTLAELLGRDFGEEEHAAWSGAYGALSEMMIEAAYGTGETPQA